MDVSFEERLGADLHAALGDGPPPVGDFAEIERQGRRRQRRRRVAGLGVVASTLVVVVALGVLAVGWGGSSSHVEVGAGEGPTTSVPTSTTVTVSTGMPIASATALGTDQVDGVAGTPDGAWVSLWGTGEVVRVDSTGAITARVPVGTGQNGPLAIAYGDGAVWVLDFSSFNLLRIDPATAAVTGTFHFAQEPERLAVGRGQVFVTTCCIDQPPNQQLLAIDAASLRLRSALPLPGQGESERVAASADGLFVTGELFDDVVQLDPYGVRVVRKIPVGAPSCALAAVPTASGVWCALGSNLIGIDPATGATATTPAPDRILAITVIDGAPAVTTPSGLYRFDGSTWQPLAMLEGLGLLAPDTGTTGGVWVVRGSDLLHLTG